MRSLNQRRVAKSLQSTLLGAAVFATLAVIAGSGCSRSAQPDPEARASAQTAARSELYRAVRSGDVALEAAWSRRATGVADAISARNREVSRTMSTLRHRADTSTTITPQTRANLRLYAALSRAAMTQWAPAAEAETQAAPRELQAWYEAEGAFADELLTFSTAPAGSEQAYEGYQELVASYNRWAAAANSLVTEVGERPEGLLDIHRLWLSE